MRREETPEGPPDEQAQQENDMDLEENLTCEAVNDLAL